MFRRFLRKDKSAEPSTMPPSRDVAVKIPVNLESSNNSHHGSHRSDEDKRQTHRGKSSWTDRLVRFWFEDLPPLHGPLRFVFYAMMFLVIRYSDTWWAFRSYPTKDTFFVEGCRRNVGQLERYDRLRFQFKAETGIFRWILRLVRVLGVPYERVFPCDALTRCLSGGLLLSAIGLGGRLPRVSAALSFWILFGIRNSKWTGQSSHSHYLGGWALLALCLAEDNVRVDGWSLDAILVEWFHRRVRTPAGSPRSAVGGGGHPTHGGGSRKFVLVVAVISMYFAGLHKVTTWGLRWMDGGTIRMSMETEESRWQLLRTLFVEHPVLTVPLATMSVVGEIGAVAVLLSRWWRPFGIASFYAFHIGIFLLMQPNFVCNEVTYLLLFDWMDVRNRILQSTAAGRRRNASASGLPTSGVDDRSDDLNAKLPTSKSSNHKHECDYPKSMRVGAWAYTTIALAMVVSGLLRYDGFPFYSWALYNTHPSEVGNRPLLTAKMARDAAHRCLTKPPLNPACWNHGTTKHHDRFHKTIAVSNIMVIGNSALINSTESSTACDLRVYRDSKQHSCHARNHELTLQEQLRVLLKEGVYETKKWKRAKTKKSFVDFTERAQDAAAASIDEGPSCFVETAATTTTTTTTRNEKGSSPIWKDDTDPSTPAARFSRHVRSVMSEPANARYYFGSENRKVLAAGISFKYLSDDVVYDAPTNSPESYNKEHLRYCLLGSSMFDEDLGENRGVGRSAGAAVASTRLLSNHEVGSKTKPPRPDWSEVWRGIVFTVFLALVIQIYSRWRKVSWKDAR